MAKLRKIIAIGHLRYKADDRSNNTNKLPCRQTASCKEANILVNSILNIKKSYAVIIINIHKLFTAL
jgi:hypothetical protein